MNPRCPVCKKPMKSELELGIDPMVGYFIQSALLAVIESGRSPYYACVNPKCRCCFSENNKFWFKQTSLGVRPVSLLGQMGFYPPKKRKK